LESNVHNVCPLLDFSSLQGESVTDDILSGADDDDNDDDVVTLEQEVTPIRNNLVDEVTVSPETSSSQQNDEQQAGSRTRTSPSLSTIFARFNSNHYICPHSKKILLASAIAIVAVGLIAFSAGSKCRHKKLANQVRELKAKVELLEQNMKQLRVNTAPTMQQYLHSDLSDDACSLSSSNCLRQPGSKNGGTKRRQHDQQHHQQRGKMNQEEKYQQRGKMNQDETYQQRNNHRQQKESHHHYQHHDDYYYHHHHDMGIRGFLKSLFRGFRFA
jgi:outer membrane murein-binding lipoprotein Lpp